MNGFPIFQLFYNVLFFNFLLLFWIDCVFLPFFMFFSFAGELVAKG